jgi:hypothetical protein
MEYFLKGKENNVHVQCYVFAVNLTFWTVTLVSAGTGLLNVSISGRCVSAANGHPVNSVLFTFDWVEYWVGFLTR